MGKKARPKHLTFLTASRSLPCVSRSWPAVSARRRAVSAAAAASYRRQRATVGARASRRPCSLQQHQHQHQQQQHQCAVSVRYVSASSSGGEGNESGLLLSPYSCTVPSPGASMRGCDYVQWTAYRSVAVSSSSIRPAVARMSDSRDASFSCVDADGEHGRVRQAA